MRASMSTRLVVLRPERGYPFHVLAKRYTPNGTVHRRDGQTLLLLHSTSFHKEVYEPTLDDLLIIAKRESEIGGDVKINEIWVIECPNHGESAIYNQDVLRLPEYESHFSCERYAEAAHHFLTAKDDSGHPYIKANLEHVVAIGHSLGGVSIIFLAKTVQFASLIIVDPFLFPGDPGDLQSLRRKLVRGAHERRDVWPSREDAKKSLEALKWDGRVLDVYVKHAIREHPTWTNGSMPYKGFSLACTREQEATMYRDQDGATKPIAYLEMLITEIPIHIAFGATPDIIPRYVQNNIVESVPQPFASITWIEGVGHLVPQYAPKSLAKLMYRVLQRKRQSWQGARL